MKEFTLPRLQVDKAARNESQNVKYRFDISDNMKKVNRMLKDIIDVKQAVSEMSDELLSLQQNYGDRMSTENLAIIRNMQNNVRKLGELMSREEEGSVTGYTFKLQDNLEQLKRAYLKKAKD